MGGARITRMGQGVREGPKGGGYPPSARPDSTHLPLVVDKAWSIALVNSDM